MSELILVLSRASSTWVTGSAAVQSDQKWWKRWISSWLPSGKQMKQDCKSLLFQIKSDGWNIKLTWVSLAYELARLIHWTYASEDIVVLAVLCAANAIIVVWARAHSTELSYSWTWHELVWCLRLWVLSSVCDSITAPIAVFLSFMLLVKIDYKSQRTNWMALISTYSFKNFIMIDNFCRIKQRSSLSGQTSNA